MFLGLKVYTFVRTVDLLSSNGVSKVSEKSRFVHIDTWLFFQLFADIVEVSDCVYGLTRLLHQWQPMRLTRQFNGEM